MHRDALVRCVMGIIVFYSFGVGLVKIGIEVGTFDLCVMFSVLFDKYK